MKYTLVGGTLRFLPARLLFPNFEAIFYSNANESAPLCEPFLQSIVLS
jgi:hypothetical protein